MTTTTVALVALAVLVAVSAATGALIGATAAHRHCAARPPERRRYRARLPSRTSIACIEQGLLENAKLPDQGKQASRHGLPRLTGRAVSAQCRWRRTRSTR